MPLYIYQYELGFLDTSQKLTVWATDMQAAKQDQRTLDGQKKHGRVMFVFATGKTKVLDSAFGTLSHVK